MASARERRALKLLQAMEPACGQCRWWRDYQAGDGMGRCMLNPPVVMMDPEDGEPFTTWPILAADDFACSHFKPKQ